MRKFFALVLSVGIILSSVPPSWAQVTRGGYGIVRGFRGVPSSLSSALSRRVPARFAFGKNTFSPSVSQAVQIDKHPVWKLQNKQQQTLAFLKLGANEELKRTRQFHHLMQKIQPRLHLIDVEYPQVLSEGWNKLPSKIKKQANSQMQNFLYRTPLPTTPFILSAVDTSGTLLNVDDISHFSLNFSITEEEWEQIAALFHALQEENFDHRDLNNNLWLKRQPNGKLKLTILDFEEVHLWSYVWEDFEYVKRLEYFLRQKNRIIPATPHRNKSSM